MKKFLPLILLLINISAFSQSFDWVRSQPINFNSNPSQVRFPLSINNANEIINVRTDSVLLLFSRGSYGIQQIEKRNNSGNLLWSFSLSSHCFVDDVITDKAGKIYIAGTFMDTLNLNNQDTLVNTGWLSNFITNTFMICLDTQGNLIWKRNVQRSNSDIEFISSIACDNQNNLWYSYSDFMTGHIIKTDASGQDLQTLPIVDAKIIGGIDFDIYGGMFIAGAAEQGTFSLGNLNYTVTDSYNYFIAYYNSLLQPAWAKFGHDVTFHTPIVKCDAFGNAFVASDIMDSTAFGNVNLHHPQWVYDFMLLKVDTSGNFIWGFQTPLQPTITGDFSVGTNSYLDCDSKGNVYIAGTVRFYVDFGNGVIASVDTSGYNALSFLALDSSGIPQWTLLGGGDNFQQINSIAFDQDDNLFFTGTIRDSATFGNIILANPASTNFLLGKIATPTVTGLNNHSDSSKEIIYPNPSNGELNIPASLLDHTFKIYDVSGRIVYSLDKIAQSKLNLNQLKAGIYLLSFSNEKSNYTSRWVKTGN